MTVAALGEAGADGGDQHRRGPVMVVDALAHEARAILVPGEHDPDAGPVERVHDGEHLAARDAEGMAAAGPGQPPGNQVRRIGHVIAPRAAGMRPSASPARFHRGS